jgi:hypothetical protein
MLQESFPTRKEDVMQVNARASTAPAARLVA